MTPRGVIAPAESATAVSVLAAKGYDSTTVDDLAQAYGISRSTFFRRYRSKDDVVFVDHDVKLASIAKLLAERDQDPLNAVGEASLDILRFSINDPVTARARHQLLQQVPSLRDREVISSHRYERVFRDYLRNRLPQSDNRELGSVAFASAVVAVHNAVLRKWLREEMDSSISELTIQLEALESAFRPYLALGQTANPGVVVARIPSEATDAAIVRTIREALSH